MNTNTKRRWILGIGLGLTLLATIFAPKPDDSGVVAATRGAHERVAPSVPDSPRKDSTEPDLTVLALQPRQSTPADARLFFTPPKPQPLTPLVRQASFVPEEPPLPSYTVIGRYHSDNAQLVLLANGKDSLQVQEGEAVGNGWFVKRITENSIVFASPSGKEQLLQTEDNP